MALAPAAAWAAFDPAVVFDSKCSSCHSVGRGVVVGPDLKGVTSRHDTEWLHSFIRSSQAVIRSGDPSANQLFNTYKRVMPDHPFSDHEIDTLLAFIQAGGPASVSRGEEIRHASTATSREVSRGRDLFLGRVAFAKGGAACVHCHTAGAAGRLNGGALAQDLTRSYTKYQDWGLHQALSAADFPLMKEIYGPRPLSAEEVFAVKAFLQRSAAGDSFPDERVPNSVAFLGLGSSALVLLAIRRGSRKGEGDEDSDDE